MVTTTINDPAIICAERIAALHFLHHVPVPPSANPVTNIHRRSAGYTLPFEKERGLAGTLAFLASTKDDVDHIPAVCIEEARGAKHLNVILAVNKADRTSGQQLLQELKKSFEGIFSLLAQLDADSSNVEIDVFRAIISMCSRRILYRLRLRGRKVHYQSIEKALQTVYEHLRHTEQEEFKGAGALAILSQFIEKASEVLKLVRAWAGHQTDFRLEELVEGIYRLHKVGNLCALIENGHIPDQIMEPNLRKSLLNMISKVARYREAARFLYRMGKKFPLARRMRVVIVQWSKKSFKRGSYDEYTPRLKTTISLAEGLKNHEKDLAYICRLLNGDKEEEQQKLTSEKAGDKFEERTRETLRNAKIHAEIQLLYYCEQNVPHERLPRVVCSSKDACWLCNEFILLYEKIHMPKSHGRLYPGWRLPALGRPEFVDLANRYNQRLQGSLTESLKRLFERKKRTNYAEPNESTLLTLYLSDSTLSSVSLPLSDGNGRGVVEVVQEVVVPSQEESTHRSSPADDEESEGTIAEVEEIEEVTPEDSATAPEQGQVDGSILIKDEKSEETIEQAGEAEGTLRTSPTSSKRGPIHDPILVDDEKSEEAVEEAEETEVAPKTLPTHPEPGPMSDAILAHNERGQEPIAELEETEVAPEVSAANDEEISDMPESSTNTSSSESSRSSKNDLALELGEVRHQRIKIGKTTPIYQAGSLLDVQLEYASGPSLLAPDGHRKKLSYVVERLKPEDVESLQSRGVVPIVGAELPGYWVDGNTNEDGSIYIANGDAVMRLLILPASNHLRNGQRQQSSI
ncbi:hypothetical protein F5Y06DRAFT_269405 [Hypoxylon sp. FL0890]|nr:hypothetical protein F5Y06DRAFT_269405 [Hypoxylon sp. FL0890]